MRARRTGGATPCEVHREVVIITVWCIRRCECSVCSSPNSRSVGGCSSKNAAYYVRRSCTPSRHVSMYFFMYHAHPSDAASPHFSLLALARVTLSAPWHLVREARSSSTSGKTHPTRGADGAEVLPGARRVGEQLVQKHLNGCVCLYMDILQRLSMQEYAANRAECDVGSRASQE